AGVRSELDRISRICADDSGGEACSASVAGMPRRTLVMIATKTSFRVIFIGDLPSFGSTNHTRNEHGAAPTALLVNADKVYSRGERRCSLSDSSSSATRSSLQRGYLGVRRF